jgi:hypothetical protein
VDGVMISFLYLKSFDFLDCGRISQVLGNLNGWGSIYVSVFWGNL